MNRASNKKIWYRLQITRTRNKSTLLSKNTFIYECVHDSLHCFDSKKGQEAEMHWNRISSSTGWGLIVVKIKMRDIISLYALRSYMKSIRCAITDIPTTINRRGEKHKKHNICAFLAQNHSVIARSRCFDLVFILNVLGRYDATEAVVLAFISRQFILI